MADRGDQLHEVLDGYAKFLQQKNLALDKHQPYLVRWVREFLLFAWTLPDTASNKRWICFWPKWAGAWARSRGSFSRHRTRYASTAINTAEPRQERTARPQRKPSWTMQQGWTGCARSSAWGRLGSGLDI